jgi:N-acetylmuramic acid 6-phosphate etherase
MLKTESPASNHANLDQYTMEQLVDVFADDGLAAVQAVRAASAQLTAALEAALPRIAADGRLIYAGAGTSGRLGVLDSVELPPTFSWPRERAVALMAGGHGALLASVEGAEDDELQGERDLAALAPGIQDVVLLLAASGTTPYVLGALKQAKRSGALTIGIANNPDTPLTTLAEYPILLDTGAELISGSTRLKAGTAQKLALNTFSSCLMVKLGKVYGNLMVDLRASNAKLRKRALVLTQRASGAEEIHAQRMLEQSGYQVKTAIVALKKQIGTAEARELLTRHAGNIRKALGE